MGDDRALIQQAEDAVQRGDRTADTIRPAELADLLPEMSSILSDATLVETADRYEQRDAAAVAAQRQYRRLSLTGTWLVFAASTSAAVLATLSGVTVPGPSWRSVSIALALVALIGGVLATGVLYVVNNRRLLRRWMRCRSAAEAERIGYFNKLARLAAERASSDPWRLLLTLELFRTYQLDVEEAYYTRRAKDHLRSRRVTVLFGAAAAMIVAGIGGGVGLWAVLSDSGAVSLAALGTIGAGIATVASRREELLQDERNAERYERTADQLSRVREKHSDTQRALAAGKASVLPKYVAAVHELLSNEHREWIEDVGKMSEALHELTGSLSRELGSNEER